MRLGSPSRACALRSRPRTGRRALDSRSSRSRARCAQLGTLEPHSCPRSCPHMLTAASRCSQVVEWDEVKFDVRLMQRVPYEGVSRMQTSLRRKREPLLAPNPPLFLTHADPAHRARVVLCRSRSCRAPRPGSDHRVGLREFPAALNPHPISPSHARATCLCAVRDRRWPRALRRPIDVDPVLRAGGERPRRDVCVFAPPSTTLRCPRSPPRPLPHAQTCNFDVLYAYLTSANYDFSCTPTAAPTLHPPTQPLHAH